MTVPAALGDGTAGSLVGVADGKVSLRIARALAPGAPFELVAALTDGPLPMLLKVVTIRRVGDGFDVVARPINLSRAALDRLVRELSPG